MAYSYYTWTAYEQASATKLNAYLRDNLEVLRQPATTVNNVTATSHFTTSSASLGDVGTAYEAAVVTGVTSGTTTLMVTGAFSLRPNTGTANQTVLLDLMLNGTSVTTTAGILRCRGNADTIYPVNLSYWLTDVPAGTATVKLRWAVNGGTAQLLALDGGANQVRGQFAVREVS